MKGGSRAVRMALFAVAATVLGTGVATTQVDLAGRGVRDRSVKLEKEE